MNSPAARFDAPGVPAIRPWMDAARLPRLSSRGAVMLGVLGLHAVMLYVGLHLALRDAKPPELPPIQTTLMTEATQRAAPELPRPVLAPVTPETVVPDITIDVPAPDAITLPPPKAAPAPAQPQAPQAPPVISQADYLTPPRPHYPPEARRQHAQGTVILRVLISPTGRADEILVQRSSGHPRLDAAAVEAVSHAVFRPYVRNGAPSAAIVIIPIEFLLQLR